MSPNQEHHAVVVEATPIVRYRSPYEQDILHWDGCFFGFLCVVSWIMFAYLWSMHLSKPPHRPPPLPRLKVENFVGSHHWRN